MAKQPAGLPETALPAVGAERPVMSAVPESADFSLRIVWSVARWIEDTKGSEALATAAALAGVRPEDFDGSSRQSMG